MIDNLSLKKNQLSKSLIKFDRKMRVSLYKNSVINILNKTVHIFKFRFAYKSIFVFLILTQFIIAIVSADHQQLNKIFRNSLKQQRLLLISFGGFRHDFIETYKLRHFAQFFKDGARAAYLNPQFPTQTLPNHWSIATGCNVETHGIIADKFFDPFYNEMYSSSKKESKWWNSTEPIWYTAVKQGIKTGTFFWPGSNVNYNDYTLFKSLSYHENLPFHIKTNHTLRLILNDEYKFMALYHNQPDSIAQKYGINSAEFNVTLKQLDESFGMFVEQLKANGLFHLDDFNVIVLSDQGVSNINRNIVLSDYINDNDVNIWSFSRSLVHLKPKIDLDRLLLKLSKIPDITVTLKEDMPTRLHYKNNRRIGEVILSALEGVGFIYVNKEPIKFNHNGKTINLNDDHKRRFIIAAADKATNGYDKAYENMRGIFMAKGPMFKRNFYSEEPIENIDIYPLICNLLAIECEQRNSTDKAIRTYLKYEHKIVKLESEKQIFMNESNKSIHLNQCFIVIYLVLTKLIAWCFCI